MYEPMISVNVFNVSWLAMYLTFAVLIVRHWKSQPRGAATPASFTFLLTSFRTHVATNWRSFIAILVLLVSLHIALDFAIFWLTDRDAAFVPDSYPSQALAVHWVGNVIRVLLSGTLGLIWLRAVASAKHQPMRFESLIAYFAIFYVIFDLSLIVFGWFIWTIPTTVLAIVTGEGFGNGMDFDPVLSFAAATCGMVLAVILGRYAHLAIVLPASLGSGSARIPGIVTAARPFAVLLAFLLLTSWAFVRLSDATFSYVEMLWVFNGFPVESGGGAFAGDGDGVNIISTLVGMVPRALTRAVLFLFALSLIQSVYQAALTSQTKTPPG